MGCDYVELPGGVRAIVCGPRRSRSKAHKCVACSKFSVFQCDWIVGRKPIIRDGKQTLEVKRCDAHLCADHARQVATDKHVCPVHSITFDNWKRAQDAKLSASG